MVSVVNKEGKYPEQVSPLDEKQIMKDDSFLLMQQCLRDARQLFTLTRTFYYSSLSEFDSETYRNTVIKIAGDLFNARLSNPIDFETMKKLLMVTDSAVQETQECLGINQEITEILEKLNEGQAKLSKITKEVEKEKQTQIKLRGQNFLLSTIGQENVRKLNVLGYLDIEGTNKATYRVHKDGRIDSFNIKNNWRGKEKTELRWSGKIVNGNIDDGIATVYLHIKNNSNKFDHDKACGAITIET